MVDGKTGLQPSESVDDTKPHVSSDLPLQNLETVHKQPSNTSVDSDFQDGVVVKLSPSVSGENEASLLTNSSSSGKESS